MVSGISRYLYKLIDQISSILRAWFLTIDWDFLLYGAKLSALHDADLQLAPLLGGELKKFLEEEIARKSHKA